MYFNKLKLNIKFYLIQFIKYLINNLKIFYNSIFF